MTAFLLLLLVLLSVPAALMSLYLLVFTLLSRQASPVQPVEARLCFDIVVPAHDEAGIIERVVASLRRIDWPADRFRILVVADNCSDTTAVLARAAGATVLERQDPLLRGKGYALAFAFATSAAQGFADAVVVVDADSEVSPNLLRAFAARLLPGVEAVQAHYGVLNAQDSWRTRLMTIAMASFHIVRSRARERLGLSCGLRGNGWCVTHRVLKQVPYAAYSLAEDIEFGIALGLAGHRVHYADEAHVDAMQVSGEHAARVQRQRWDSGRWSLLRSKLMPLLRAAMRPGGRVCADLAMDLLVWPLSYVALNVLLLGVVAGAALLWFGASASWLLLAAACTIGVLLYVLRGWQLSGVGPRGLVDLAASPFFMLWMVLLMLRPRGAAQWVRTKRESS
jgi:cellulose synthase/poly-beta-1,6-N-acetylglucosamine synthase-like glycosyltransferase